MCVCVYLCRDAYKWGRSGEHTKWESWQDHKCHQMKTSGTQVNLYKVFSCKELITIWINSCINTFKRLQLFLIQPLWKTVWRFLRKLKIELPYDPAFPLLGIYPDKTVIQKETSTPMFIVALFTRAKTWKQPKCPSTDEWIKMW